MVVSPASKLIGFYDHNTAKITCQSYLKTQRLSVKLQIWYTISDNALLIHEEHTITIDSSISSISTVTDEFSCYTIYDGQNSLTLGTV